MGLLALLTFAFCLAGKNLAMIGDTFQVDTMNGGVSERAMDRNNNPMYSGSSCTLTTSRKNPWWAVDFKLLTDIHFVLITNRMDCCSERLSNLRIGTTKHSPATTTPTLQNIDVCASRNPAVGAGVCHTFKCRALARYVVVMIQKTDHLTLCEVEVYEDNIAHSKRTLQSSTINGGESHLAVDGNADVNYMNSFSCTHTNHQTNPWWSVDFGWVRRLIRVVITNRGDYHAFRLSRLRIGTTHVDPSSVRDPPIRMCAYTYQPLEEGESRSIPCHATDRFLVIKIDGSGVLMLCEVRVFQRSSNIFDLPEKVVAYEGDAVIFPVRWKSESGNFVSFTWSEIKEGPLPKEESVYEYMDAKHHTSTPSWRHAFEMTRYYVESIMSLVIVGFTREDTRTKCIKVKTADDRPLYMHKCTIIEFHARPNIPAPPGVTNAGSNLALHGTTYQVDVMDGGLASRAVDGNNNAMWNGLSCTLTNGHENPWWAVDLHHYHHINFVIITNRKDCCSERLSNLHIGTTDNHPAVTSPTLYNIKVCASQDAPLAAGERKTILCRSIGRHVVVLINKFDYLTLCEVEVYADNLAYSQRTNQSDTYTDGLNGGQSHLAVDGNADVHYNTSRTCTLTISRRHPWWSVDFGRIRNVGSVVITNRGDCCAFRLEKLRIGTTDVDPSSVAPVLGEFELCAYVDGPLGLGETRSILCVATSRFLVIMLERTGFLTLCEVQVLEENIALGKRTFQIGDHQGRFSQAVDGIMNTNHQQSPCTLTNHIYRPWWVVDFMKYYEVARVVITKRGDCCSENTGTLMIGLSNSTGVFTPPDVRNMSYCVYITADTPLEARFYCFAGGRYMTIMLVHTGILTFCEVQVFAATPELFEGPDTTEHGHDADAQTDMDAILGGSIGGGVGMVVIVAIIAAIAHRYRKKPEEEKENLPAAVSPPTTTAAVAATDAPGVKIN